MITTPFMNCWIIIERKLPQDKQEAYERLWADERFKGRKSLLREIEAVLIDF